jgi:MFS transporter
MGTVTEQSPGPGGAVRRLPATGLRRRLMPLYGAVFLQNLALWVPIEKLFMTSIGFDAAGVGLMAAMYAAVVPLFEVPSGLLADRWSRRGVLVLASVAAAVSVTIGGLSQNVPTYMVAAAFLGLYFAMQSGTVESIVYDTVLEETGDSESFERTIGRLRLVESVDFRGYAPACAHARCTARISSGVGRWGTPGRYWAAISTRRSLASMSA